MPDLLPQQMLALSRAVGAKALATARDQLKDGTVYDVDFGVRISGRVLVGHETSFTASKAPSASEVIQCLLAQFGPRKRRAIVDEIAKTGIARTIAPDGKVPEDLEPLASRLIGELSTESVGKRRGNVTGDVEVTAVEWS